MAIIHIINNAVSRAFVADGVLAYGGAPMMTENPLEFKAIHQHSGALLINLGMMDIHKKQIIMKACESAVEAGIPIGIDPVGIHISPWRLEVFHEIMSKFEIAYVKGNQDEVYCGIFGMCNQKGISLEAMRHEDVELFQSKLLDSGTIWLVSGERDFIVGRGRCGISEGGTPDLRKISGAGCLLGALVAVNISSGMSTFDAALKASSDLKQSSEGFTERGVGTLKLKIIDCLGVLGGSNV